MQQLDLRDTRPAAILSLVGAGSTAIDAARQVGISRKTVERWRHSVPGFGAAYERAAQLSGDGTPAGRDELELLVRTWTPGGLAELPDLREPLPTPAAEPLEVQPAPKPPRAEPKPAPARDPAAVRPPVARRPRVEPDVLGARGEELTVRGARASGPAEPSPYSTVRPPTRDEWHAMMAAVAMDGRVPERVRVTAIAAVSSGLSGGPVRARPAELEEVVAAAASRGRDPGVPASVWAEAKRHFLGPAPEPELDDATHSGDVVEFERVPR